jgi:membrane protease YdiL (CAAX protease family)
MTTPVSKPGHSFTFWTKLPTALRAVVTGLVVFAVSANVWLLLLLNLNTALAAALEVVFLGLVIWWSHGGGPPKAAQVFREKVFRRTRLTSAQWIWGIIAAVFFAATVHSSIVLLFRFMPYPAAAFRRDYDLSFIPSEGLRWLVVAISAASAAICEEIGFRGFMQQPIEGRDGVSTAIFTSSFFFMLLHLSKAWSSLGMAPIVFGAGILLGLLASSSESLIPGIIGHFVMDVGLFAYWWTGIAGTFSTRPISQTGMDGPFLIACCAFAISLSSALVAMARLRKPRHR